MASEKIEWRRTSTSVKDFKNFLQSNAADGAFRSRWRSRNLHHASYVKPAVPLVFGTREINPREVSSLSGWKIGTCDTNQKFLFKEELFCNGKSGCTRPTNPRDTHFGNACCFRWKWAVLPGDLDTVHIEYAGTHGLNFEPVVDAGLSIATKKIIWEAIHLRLPASSNLFMKPSLTKI
jgi:hypothetical protein